jgi:hypothetical protein
VLVVISVVGKVFFESYFVKSALGTGYSFKPVKDGNAVDAGNTNKISSTMRAQLILFVIIPSRDKIITSIFDSRNP